MSQDNFQSALQNSRDALRRGNRSAACFWAQKAADIAPDQEDPWLILAAVADPKASLVFLKRALEINPSSQRARKGMQWAIQRYRKNQSIYHPGPILFVQNPIPSEALVRHKPVIFPWLILILVVCAFLLVGLGYPNITAAFSEDKPVNLPQILQPIIDTPTPTTTDTESPLVTATIIFTPSPTASYTPAFTPTELHTDTPVPTNTPLPTDTSTPIPSDTPQLPTDSPTEQSIPTIGPNGKFSFPDVNPGERWVDVDLSQQRAYAFEGQQIVNVFVVSTGLPRTPTVTGQFHIYVKYRSADMSGPGYYLPDVPFVMYFFKDYGLHGTYWHKNFGRPMSHGCVNFKTKDAQWLFEWTSVGTLVNVHR